MWIPVDDNIKYPCILEYLPYWASVWTKKRDEKRHSLFAQNGYVSLRVDFRGSGDSEGVYYDEYLK
jgi:predicted acyl esterase